MAALTKLRQQVAEATAEIEKYKDNDPAAVQAMRESQLWSHSQLHVEGATYPTACLVKGSTACSAPGLVLSTGYAGLAADS